MIGKLLYDPFEDGTEWYRMTEQGMLINWLNRKIINEKINEKEEINEKGDFLEEIKNNITEKEYVNHPDHYNNKYECIDVMEDVFGQEATFNFCLLNAFKYLYRCLRKHNSPTEDIKKAIWYLNKTLQLENQNCMQNIQNDNKEWINIQKNE